MRKWLISGMLASIASTASAGSQSSTVEDLARLFNWACHLEGYDYQTVGGEYSLRHHWRGGLYSQEQFADASAAEGFDLEAIRFSGAETPMDFDPNMSPVVSCELSFATSLTPDEYSRLAHEIVEGAKAQYEPTPSEIQVPGQFGAFHSSQNANVVLSGSNSDDALTLRATATVSK
ncbi:MAG: hypothetical protein ACR2O2_16860 [Ruegeria sp.]